MGTYCKEYRKGGAEDPETAGYHECDQCKVG